ncbi:unnamed protein product [Ranitomeya imitator]|uniref:Uncharacterized protein n=1 Tax=Ranitomeya imitator TaxID=111125 RepID=A0ABN9LIP0_9NEOB|nr:unnamed protein product [Ranitomeya imitator]
MLKSPMMMVGVSAREKVKKPGGELVNKGSGRARRSVYDGHLEVGGRVDADRMDFKRGEDKGREEEDMDVRLSIQEALSMMVGAYTNLEGAQLTLMEALVGSYLVKPEVQVRQVAVKFASNVFSPDHIPSRYLLLLSAGDPREEVYGEAQRALRTFSANSENQGTPLKLPSFPVMVSHIMDKASSRMKTPVKFVTTTSVLPFNPAAFLEIILYLRMCLAHSAGVDPTCQSLADMQDQAPALGRYVRQLMSNDMSAADSSKDGDMNPVEMYISLIQQLLSAAGGLQVMYCLLEIVSVYPQKLAALLVDKVEWIKSLMTANKEEMRELAAQLYALVVVTLSGPELKSKIQSLIKTAKDPHSPEAQHGSLLALGYLIGRYLDTTKTRRGPQDMEQLESLSILEQNETIQACVETIADTLGQYIFSVRVPYKSDRNSRTGCDSPDPSMMAAYIYEVVTSGRTLLENGSPLSIAAITALGEIGRNGALPIPDEGSGLTKKQLVESLLARIPSGKETNKAKERAIRTLGYFPVGDGNFSHQKKLLEGLMQSVEAKQIELQFTIGEAITNAAVGTKSTAARDVWIVAEDDYHPYAGVKDNDVVTWVLDQILTRHVVSVNPHVRQASCIWLLSLVKKLSEHQEIKSKLKEIQSAFISVLSDNDELSQDVASKGLGLVYELGSEQDQQELVSILVDTLMTGKRLLMLYFRVKHEVSGDTEVFQGSSIGKAPDGFVTKPEVFPDASKGLSTYKELCALASDLSQPDLVYKFMNLANHHAMWNSRKVLRRDTG